MASLEVVSKVDRQELKNAVDQAQREIGQRYDFKNTDSSIEQNELALTICTLREDRLRALRTVIEERLVKRGMSLRSIELGQIEPVTEESVRQKMTVKVGVSNKGGTRDQKARERENAEGGRHTDPRQH